MENPANLANSLPLLALALSEPLALEKLDLALLRNIVGLSLPQLLGKLASALLESSLLIVLGLEDLSLKAGSCSAARCKGNLGIAKSLERRSGSVQSGGKRTGERSRDEVEVGETIRNYARRINQR